MAAYVIVDVIVTDPEIYAQYRPLAFASVTNHGGRFVVRGGHAENLEGDWVPERIVILEFGSFAKAKEWWSSEEYRIPKALRQSASISRMIVVEGAI